MKIAVIGAGGVGAYIGALFARAGHPTALVARGAHAEAMAVDGITVHSPTQTWHARPAMVTDDCATIGTADVVFVCLKTYQLDPLLPALPLLIGPRTVVVTLQNGIDAYATVAATIGAERTLAGLVYCELHVEAPGVIRSGIEPVRLVFGPIPPTVPSAVAHALQSAASQTGMDATCVPDGRVVVWRKAIFVAAMSAVTTITGAGMGLLRDDAEAQILVTAALTEAYNVAQAEGMVFAEDPVPAALAIAASMPASARSSMSRDDAAGRPLEHEALSGAVVRRGRAIGVPTPVNQALYSLLRLKLAARTEQARIQ